MAAVPNYNVVTKSLNKHLAEPLKKEVFSLKQMKQSNSKVHLRN